MKPHHWKFLEDELDGLRTTLSPSTTTTTTTLTLSPDPLLHPINNSSSSSTSPWPLKPNSPFDFSIALMVLTLLTALFFMGFFSIYIRRFADNDRNSTSNSFSRRRRRRRLSTSDGPPRLYSSSSSSLPMWRPSSLKGLDPTTVRSLPLISYGGDAKHPIDCVICLTEFEERETVKLIPNCHHVFHPKCIDTWLESHVSCPLCRSCQIFGVDEVRLGVSRVEVDCDVTGEDQGESTVESGEARDEEEGREVGPCSLPSLGDRVELQRSLSF